MSNLKKSISNEGILIVQTGGTIDKDYPKRSKGYAFEITDPAAVRILVRIQPSLKYQSVTICRKDSQDVTKNDREKIVQVCKISSQSHILVTHGTDTLIESAQYLSKMITDKVIVLTGSFKPETFKESDAEFNVGFAIGSLLNISQCGVYIAMNANLFEAKQCSKDDVSGNFGNKVEKLIM